MNPNIYSFAFGTSISHIQPMVEELVRASSAWWFESVLNPVEVANVECTKPLQEFTYAVTENGDEMQRLEVEEHFG